MAWYDFFRTFTYAFSDDPLSKSRQRDFMGAGVSQHGAMPDIRAGQDSSWAGGAGSVRLRDSNDFVDLSSVTSRLHRYKEYNRLLGMAEIDHAMTVFADETCLAGTTKIATPHGFRTIQELAENEKDRFLVYSYDFNKQDYTLAWAHSPRKTKTAQTIRIGLDDGHIIICTPDHRILLRNGKWKTAGELFYTDKLMPFYRLPAKTEFSKLKKNQFPRIFTHQYGWINEPQFITQWTMNQPNEDMEIINKYCRMIAEGLTVRQIAKLTGNDTKTIKARIEKAGFSNKEMKWLGRRKNERSIVSIQPWKEMDVYDLSVDKHQNFATDWGIVHNCQRDDDGRVMTLHMKNEQIKKELQWLLFDRKMLNFDQKKVWDMCKRLFVNGDFFYEIVINLDNPKDGIQKVTPLPPESMFRIESTKGRLIEFQQAKEGPDQTSLKGVDVSQATNSELEQATAIRFEPHQIVHIRIGEERETFWPYGISLLESARGPAHQLRLMEDSMVVYRLTRAPERRLFYIDTKNLPPAKAEAVVKRLKDQLRKKKVPTNRGPSGASQMDERWHAPSADEDIWIPIMANSNTRVETLPGAQNLGEIDDTLYFRNKLFTALNFPKSYWNNEDPNSTRISLSAQDIKFARMIERLQSHIEDAFWQICDTHLRLVGYPEEAYEDLVIKMTPPSDWREMTRAEVVTNRITNATTILQSELMSPYDVLVEWMKYPPEKAKEIIARLNIHQLEKLKMQVIASNPELLGVGTPGPQDTEIGTDVGGPNPMLQAGAPPGPQAGPPGQPPMPDAGAPPMPPQGMRKYMDAETDDQQFDNEMPASPNSGNALPEPTDEEIRKFNLDIKDFSAEMDEEESGLSEEL